MGSSTEPHKTCDCDAPDSTLVLYIQRGYDKCFGCLIGRYETSMKRVAYRICSDYQVGEDAVQVAFLQLHTAIQEGSKEIRSAKALLLTLVRFRAIEASRRRKKNREFPAENELEKTQPPEGDTEAHDRQTACVKSLLQSEGLMGQAVRYEEQNSVDQATVIKMFGLDCTVVAYKKRKERMFRKIRQCFLEDAGNREES